jgi:tol-pal system-associated acyl-CoA thioesterase
MPSKDQPFRWPIRVYYEDTDHSGVVYYANYLRFMERARTEFFRALGFEMSVLGRETHCQFVVHRAEIAFHRPARLDDALTATVQLRRRTAARLVLDQQIRHGDAVLVEGTITLACITTTDWRPTPIPRALVRTLETID